MGKVLVLKRATEARYENLASKSWVRDLHDCKLRICKELRGVLFQLR